MNAGLKIFIARRVKRCRESMAERQLDALIVTDPVDVRYLTGFAGGDSHLVLTATRRVLVTDSRYTLQVRRECPGLALHLRKNDITQAVAQVLTRSKRPPKRPLVVGIEAEHVTVSQYRNYRRAVGKGLKSVKSLVAPLRTCKDPYELSQIKKAVRIAEDAMRALIGWLKVGMTERELAARLEYEMSRRRSTAAGFETIVAVAGHAAQPHAQPGNTRLKKNQPMLFDWGATVNGYRSDLTRCFVAGKIRPAFAEAYQWLLEAQSAAIEAVRPGAALKAIDNIARKTLLKSPFPIYGHGTGHGIGLAVHEQPLLSPKSNGELREGMVVTVEPGIYLPGRFGIRIEDDVLVTARGHQVLTTLAKDLDSCVIK